MTDTDISHAVWLKNKATRSVMSALTKARPDCARFVGGCVRNELLGVPVSDIDIATQLRPDETLRALEGAGIRALPTGIEHGTITAVCGGEPYEITSLRRDIETDGRRAVVAFTEDWQDDATRRDFRMNALYADAEGRIYDPVGGLDDIRTRQVVFIGDAETRLREDYLRLLRFFRFSAWYGSGLDAGGLNACVALKDGLRQIAAERIWKELGKLLDAVSPYQAVSVMWEHGILNVCLPEIRDVSAFRALEEVERDTDGQADGFQRLQSLLPRTAETAKSVADRLRLSRAEADRLTRWAMADDMPSPGEDLKAWLYPLLPVTGSDLVLWSWAKSRNGTVAPARDWHTALKTAQTWQRPVFPLKGADLLAQGLEPGPHIGEILRQLERRWVENGYRFEGLADAITDPHIRSALQSLH